jgi:hypothetical protein
MAQPTQADLDRWEIKGADAPLHGLLGQFDYSSSVAQELKPILLAGGLTEEQFNELMARGAALGAATGKKHKATLESKNATTEEGSGVDEAKDQFYTLRQLFPMIVRQHNVTIPEDALAPAGSLGRSATKISKQMNRTREVVVQLEEYLRPYYHGESPVAVHDRIIAKLSAANGKQENRRRNLPNETRELNVAKGALLEAIEDLNRIGRIAFMGQASVAARFNKDILLAARRKGRKGSGEPTSETPATTTADIDPSISE